MDFHRRTKQLVTWLPDEGLRVGLRVRLLRQSGEEMEGVWTIRSISDVEATCNSFAMRMGWLDAL